jgi:hypothetical protein
MTYGLSTRVFIEDGPAAQALQVQVGHSTARSWRALDPELRLALVQQALTAANDRTDAFPIAV